VLYKICDLKAGDFERFLFRSGEVMLSPCENERSKKAPKYAALRRVRV